MNSLLLSLSLLASQAGDATSAPPAEAAAPAQPTLDQLIKDGHKHIEGMANKKENLEKGLSIYAQALKDPAITKKQRAYAHVDEARAYLRLGDLILKKDNKKAIALYEKGRVSAKKAVELTPNDAEAIFWEVAMLAQISSARGVMNSLMNVPDIKKGLNKALAKDPNHSYARETLGKVYHELPGIVGGDDDKAEALFLETLKRDPKFTPAMFTIAQFYVDKGKKDEARKWLRKCLDTPVKESSIPQDHWRFNIPDCKRLLRKLDGK
jgi:tetratricopeptide (TPR) repeat protein